MSKDKRRHHRERMIAKRKKQVKELHQGHYRHENYLSKTSPFTCGDSNCAMCGNPRKFFGEKTIQERRNLQEDE